MKRTTRNVPMCGMTNNNSEQLTEWALCNSPPAYFVCYDLCVLVNAIQSTVSFPAVHIFPHL